MLACAEAKVTLRAVAGESCKKRSSGFPNTQCIAVSHSSTMDLL